MKCSEYNSCALYYKTLRTRNLRKIDRFCTKLVTFDCDKYTSLNKKTLVYYGVCRLRIHKVFIAQAPEDKFKLLQVTTVKYL
jgi:hypothetical protein